ncbi:glycosyltransferase family 2 protein [Ignavibacterium album]|uniref:glycosyltransferase family 2 protein n=1 Tax=Ignavibacterium album TaxID=591197 RepID=UPI0035B7E387
MIGKEKIGLGIITCNRVDFFLKCASNLPEVDELVVVNDGKPYPKESYPPKANIIQHPRNFGIAKSKNDALKYLFHKNCTHIFLAEDDVEFLSKSILEQYILASKVSGIKHFNYGYVRENISKNGEYLIKKVIEIKGVQIAFFQNLSGSFAYFHTDVLKSVGFMDERFKNALEHVDHTFKIIKAGYHPPLRWFADILFSNQLLDDQDKFSKKSLIQNSPFWKFRVYYNSFIFYVNNHYFPWNLPEENENGLLNYLRNVKPE